MLRTQLRYQQTVQIHHYCSYSQGWSKPLARIPIGTAPTRHKTATQARNHARNSCTQLAHLIQQHIKLADGGDGGDGRFTPKVRLGNFQADEALTGRSAKADQLRLDDLGLHAELLNQR